MFNLFQYVSKFVCSLWKYVVLITYKVPRELWLSYEALIEGYVDEYKVYNGMRLPAWYWYPWFYVASVFYMIKTSRTLLDDKLREHYRDKTCSQSVKIINKDLLEVTYEWKKKLYKIRIPVQRMELTELLRACIEEDGEEKDEYLIQGTIVNVNDYVKSFLGPREDWHQIPYTPSQLDLPNLRIYKMNAEQFQVTHRTFSRDEVVESLKVW